MRRVSRPSQVLSRVFLLPLVALAGKPDGAAPFDILTTMSPSTWYAASVGKAILVPGGGAGNDGQCLQAMDSYLHDVYHKPYLYVTGAIDVWYGGLLDQYGFSRHYPGEAIKAGDFLFYDGIAPKSGGGFYGHVSIASRDGVYTDFWAYDSNWGGSAFNNSQGYPTLHEVHHNDGYNKYINGWYRLDGGKGADTPAAVQETIPMTDDNFVNAWFIDLFGVPATQPQLAQYVNRPWMDVYNELRNALPHQQRLAYYTQVIADNDARATALTDVSTQLQVLQNKPPEVVKAIDMCAISTADMPADDASMLVKVVAWLQSLVSRK